MLLLDHAERSSFLKTVDAFGIMLILRFNVQIYEIYNLPLPRETTPPPCRVRNRFVVNRVAIVQSREVSNRLKIHY